jgi:hypothetical protein
MQGEKKKAKSRGSKGEKGQLGPGRPDRPDRIDEYNFFLAQEEALEEDVPEGKAKKKKMNDRNKSMTFFLSE